MAYLWLSLAASSGDDDVAITNRDMIAKKLTPAVLAQAQEEASAIYDRIKKGQADMPTSFSIISDSL